MKTLLIVSILFSGTGVSNTEPDPRQLREYYYQASRSSSAADQFYDLVKHTDDTIPLLLGYKGMAEFMKCYHAINPVNKLKYFGWGKENLERALALSPRNIELRYLRFTVQTSIPFFLNYSSAVNSDKQFLIENYSQIDDEELRRMVKEYMLNCAACSAEEKMSFN